MEGEGEVIGCGQVQRGGAPHTAAAQAQHLTGVRDAPHHEAVRLRMRRGRGQGTQSGDAVRE